MSEKKPEEKNEDTRSQTTQDMIDWGKDFANAGLAAAAGVGLVEGAKALFHKVRPSSSQDDTVAACSSLFRKVW